MVLGNDIVLHKTGAGPFNTITDAYPSLTKAQERVNFDSYVLIVK